MQIVIYSPKPDTEPTILDVQEDAWILCEGKKYYDEDDPQLPRALWEYVHYVSKGRWLEAEKFLRKDRDIFRAYNQFLALINLKRL